MIPDLRGILAGSSYIAPRLRTGRPINEVLLMEFEPLLPLMSAHADQDDDVLIARLHYQQTKVRSGQPATIPVDGEIVAIVRAQRGGKG